MAAKKKALSENDVPEISAKSTKDQILSAYNEVVERLEEKQVQSPLEEKKKWDERAIIAKSAQTSLDGIVSHLAALKITLTKQIDTLSENLLEEFSKLSDLKQAIAIEQAHLKELYEIKETAHSLSALMLMQKEQTEEFDIRIKEEQEQFAKEIIPFVKNSTIKFIPKSVIRSYLISAFNPSSKGGITQERIDKILEFWGKFCYSRIFLFSKLNSLLTKI